MAGRIKQPTGRYGGRTAAERQAERRSRFLDAALQLFGDSPGFRSTTIAALSEAAGLSTRQFYEEFRTLEERAGRPPPPGQRLGRAGGSRPPSPTPRTCRSPSAPPRSSAPTRPTLYRRTRAASASPSSRSSASSRAWRSSGSPAGRAGSTSSAPRRPRPPTAARRCPATTGSPPPPSSAASTASCTTGAPAGWRPRSTRWSRNWSVSCWGSCDRRGGTRTAPNPVT